MRLRSPSAVGVATALLLAVPALLGTTSAGAQPGGPAPTVTDPTAPQVRLQPTRVDVRKLLSTRLNGTPALRALGANLPHSAAINHTTSARLSALLTSDPTATIGRDGRLFYTEKTAPASQQTSAQASPATYPLDQTFLLHSRPTSSHTIYLDFGGITLTSSSWWVTNGGMTAGTFGGFTLDGSPAFSDAEKTFIQEVWRIVSEKYSPFDVDVTTQDPGPGAYTRTSSSDTTYGTHVVFSDDTNAVNQACGGNCAGVALVDVFNTIDSGDLEPAWVFTSKTWGSAALTAEDAAHEIGHTFGLEHDKTSTAEYYQGHGNWFPIMGSGVLGVGQFSKGEYADAVTTQSNPDDLAVIAAGGAPVLADDYGSSTGTATGLGSQASYTVDGVIGTAADKDVFALTRSCVGDLTATATGIGEGTSLDIQLSVLDGNGNVLATDDPGSGQDTSVWPYLPTGMNAGLTLTGAAAGNYYVQIDGVGHGDPVTNGYSDYASIGQYHLTVTGCAGASGQSPTAPTALAVTPTAHGTDGSVSWGAPASAGDAPVTGYRLGLPSGTIDVDASTFSAPVTGLTPGVTYPITVAALNTYGPSPTASANLRIGTWVPPAAPGLTATVSGTTAHISWSAPTPDPGQATLTGWHLVLLRGGVPASDNHIGPGYLGGTFTGLPIGSYRVQVTGEYTADDQTGLSTAARNFTVVTVPSAPRIGTASSGVAGRPITATAVWSPPARTGGAPISGYRVRALRLNSAGAVVQVITSPLLAGTTRSDRMRLPAGRYRFRVIAYNRVGASPVSAYSRTVTAR